MDRHYTPSLPGFGDVSRVLHPRLSPNAGHKPLKILNLLMHISQFFIDRGRKGVKQ
jgi:hypothetical protein